MVKDSTKKILEDSRKKMKLQQMTKELEIMKTRLEQANDEHDIFKLENDIARLKAKIYATQHFRRDVSKVPSGIPDMADVMKSKKYTKSVNRDRRTTRGVAMDEYGNKRMNTPKNPSISRVLADTGLGLHIDEFLPVGNDRGKTPPKTRKEGGRRKRRTMRRQKK